jgi:hypothetical protein
MVRKTHDSLKRLIFLEFKFRLPIIDLFFHPDISMCQSKSNQSKIVTKCLLKESKESHGAVILFCCQYKIARANFTCFLPMPW